MDTDTALIASDHLIDAALRVPLASARRDWSDLVDMQDLLRRGRPR